MVQYVYQVLVQISHNAHFKFEDKHIHLQIFVFPSPLKSHTWHVWPRFWPQWWWKTKLLQNILQSLPKASTCTKFNNQPLYISHSLITHLPRVSTPAWRAFDQGRLLCIRRSIQRLQKVSRYECCLAKISWSRWQIYAYALSGLQSWAQWRGDPQVLTICTHWKSKEKETSSSSSTILAEVLLVDWWGDDGSNQCPFSFSLLLHLPSTIPFILHCP